MGRFFKEIGRIWGDLGINQKVSLGMAFMGVIIAMGFLSMWSGQPKLQLLYSKIEPQEMSEIVSIIEGQKIAYEVGAGGTSIMAASNKVHSLRMQLANQGLPTGGGVGFEIFDKGNFGISDFVQRTNYIRAIQGELSRTISQLNGVRSSRVMVVVPENRLLLTNSKSRPTASVFIDTGGRHIDADSVNSIRHLVANAVEGLSLGDVAVIDHHGTVLTDEFQEDQLIGAASGQLKFRQDLESYFGNKVESMLGRVVGANNVVAKISVEIDTEAVTRVEETYDPESQVVRSLTQAENSVVNAENKAAKADASEEATGDSSNSKQVRKNTSTAYEINKSTTEIIKTPGAIKKITAAVLLGMKFKIEGEKVSYIPRKSEELEKLRVMVVNTLGVDIETTNVVLNEIPFEADPLLTMDTDIPLEEQVFQWLDIVKQLSSLIIAVVMFLMFFIMLKRYKDDPIALEIVEEKSQQVQKKSDTRGLSPEILNQLIQEKPENVSTALKNWITSQ